MRAWLVVAFVLAGPVQAAMAADHPNFFSAEERARIRVAEVKAFFVKESWSLNEEVPESESPMARRVERFLRRKFMNNAQQTPDAGGSGAVHRVTLVVPLRGMNLKYAGISQLRGYVFVRDGETGKYIARYGEIIAAVRWGAGRATRIFLANEFAEEAWDLFNAESELTGVRTVEEMVAAFRARPLAAE